MYLNCSTVMAALALAVAAAVAVNVVQERTAIVMPASSDMSSSDCAVSNMNTGIYSQLSCVPYAA
jgi:hypothetical protein